MTQREIQKIAVALADELERRRKQGSTKYYTTAEAAKMLGIKPDTLRRSSIPRKRGTKTLYFKHEDLLQYVNA